MNLREDDVVSAVALVMETSEETAAQVEAGVEPDEPDEPAAPEDPSVE
jgi:hypothetical protein